MINVTRLSPYDFKMIFSKHARLFIDLVKDWRVRPPQPQIMSEFSLRVASDRGLVEDLAWRGSRLSRETIEQMPVEELTELAAVILRISTPDQHSQRHLRRIFVASLNGALKGRPLTQPLGPGAER